MRIILKTPIQVNYLLNQFTSQLNYYDYIISPSYHQTNLSVEAALLLRHLISWPAPPDPDAGKSRSCIRIHLHILYNQIKLIETGGFPFSQTGESNQKRK